VHGCMDTRGIAFLDHTHTRIPSYIDVFESAIRLGETLFAQSFMLKSIPKSSLHSSRI
jgi:hypothetical protein